MIWQSQGINKFGKSRGGSAGGTTGFIGAMTNLKVYQKWMRTTHLRAELYEEALRMADLVSCSGEPHEHKDTRKTTIMDQEEDVQRTLEVFTEAFMNPFAAPGKDLFIISSGVSP